MRRLALLLALAASPSLAAGCQSLIDLSLPNTTITLAEHLPAEWQRVSPPGAVNRIPPHCRVTAILKPTSDSSIQIEVRMPDPESGGAPDSPPAWNGKFNIGVNVTMKF